MLTLEQRRVQNMLVTVHKCLHGAALSNLWTYLQMRDAGFHFLRGFAKLKQPAVRTETFGICSFRHLAPKVWNKLPESQNLLEQIDNLFAFIDKNELLFFLLYLFIYVSWFLYFILKSSVCYSEILEQSNKVYVCMYISSSHTKFLVAFLNFVTTYPRRFNCELQQKCFAKNLKIKNKFENEMYFSPILIFL